MFTTSMPMPTIPHTDARDHLLGHAQIDLWHKRGPIPRMLAHRGEDLVGEIELRDGADHTKILVEVLSLLLPLGADRITMAITARGWHLNEPAPPAPELMPRLLLVLAGHPTADKIDVLGEARRIVRNDDGRETLADPEDVAVPDGALPGVLRTLLEHRNTPHPRRHLLASQFARLLLLGYQISLSADPLAQLLADTAYPDQDVAPNGCAT